MQDRSAAPRRGVALERIDASTGTSRTTESSRQAEVASRHVCISHSALRSAERKSGGKIRAFVVGDAIDEFGVASRRLCGVNDAPTCTQPATCHCQLGRRSAGVWRGRRLLPKRAMT